MWGSEVPLQGMWGVASVRGIGDWMGPGGQGGAGAMIQEGDDKG